MNASLRARSGLSCVDRLGSAAIMGSSKWVVCGAAWLVGGCLPSRPSAAPESTRETWGTSAKATPSDTLQAKLCGAFLYIAQEPVDANDVAALQQTLSRKRGQASRLELTLVKEDEPTLGRVIAASAGSGLRWLSLSAGTWHFDLALRPSKAPTHELGWLAERQVLQLRPLEEGANSSVLEWPTSNPEPFQMPVCGSGCLVRVVHEADSPPLSEMLRGVELVLSHQTKVQLVVEPRLPPVERSPADEAEGSLPPEIIARIVHESADAFRQCYLLGYERNHELRGSIWARFVIGRDGHVTKVEDAGSGIADADVRDCALTAFKNIIFPAPEGGVVRVLYPLKLSPGRRY